MIQRNAPFVWSGSGWKVKNSVCGVLFDGFKTSDLSKGLFVEVTLRLFYVFSG